MDSDITVDSIDYDIGEDGALIKVAASGLPDGHAALVLGDTARSTDHIRDGTVTLRTSYGVWVDWEPGDELTLLVYAYDDNEVSDVDQRIDLTERAQAAHERAQRTHVHEEGSVHERLDDLLERVRALEE